jgi:hypothetical protein
LGRSISTIRSTRRLRSTSVALLAGIGLLALLAARVSHAAEELLQVFVAQPYLELHTGPGRGYPITQVVPRGESVDILYRRTDWFRVRTERGVLGWASLAQMQKTELADGTLLKIDLGDRAGFANHRWEMGGFLGEYARANLISAYAAGRLTPNLGVDLTISQFLGNVETGYIAEFGVEHVLFPEWRFSPLITLGGGLYRVDASRSAQLLDRTDEDAYAGLGFRFYLTRRFFVRGEWKERVIITKRNENEELKEWKLGLAFFF